jgi:ribosomal protein S18 acetylase RimI-like enzyme
VSTPFVVVRLLGPTDVAVLERVADGVFDNPIDEALAREFVDDPRHHLAVAISEDQVVVGMASAVHYIHPDKAAQLFINEVGVAKSHQRQGIGSRLVSELLALGRRLGCTEAWVATEPDNKAARSLYEKAGGQQDSTLFVMYTFPLLKP